MNPKYHLLVAVAALSLGACSTDDTCPEPMPENEGRKISFTVAEDAETRTTLEMLEAGNFLRWVSTDKVGIYTVGQSVNSNIETTADVSKSPVEFVGTLEQPVSSGDKFYAYYPYNAEQTTDPAAVKLSIPAEQSQTKAGVYNGESNPLVAVPMEFSQEWGNAGRINSVRFRQLGAIVELQLYSSNEALRSESICSVTFGSETPLAGDFSLNLKNVTVNNELPISGYTSKMVTTLLEAPAAIPATKDEAARVYLTIAPGQYTGEIVVKTNVAKYTFRLKNAMDFGRAAIKGLPADLAKVERIVLSPDELVTVNYPIHFEDSTVEEICLANWDANNNGELSYKEAAEITSIGTLFKGKSIRSFDELQYFTGLQLIEKNAFVDCSNLTSITIPDGVTTIENAAFFNCSSLTSIHISDGVTSIGVNAFWGCSSLTSINLPDGITAIGRGTFADCISLTSIHIPDGVTTIGYQAFVGCSNLTSITIPDGVTAIHEGTFWDCSSLTNINLPNGVTTIEKMAFMGCSSLTSINIPDKVTTIGDSAFVRCSRLKSIHIPNGVAAIGQSTFERCSSLTSINIPERVTSIGNSAFSGCSSLTSINIPKGVTAIGQSTFERCSSLTNINIPEIVTSIGNSAFSGCSSLTSINIPNGVTAIGNGAFGGCSSLTSISIPEGVTAIGDETFMGCSSLTSINIPKGVTAIGNGAFGGCSSLTSISIPEGVTAIGDETFMGCSSLTSIDIPQTFSSIGINAFAGCSSLSAFEGKYASTDHRCLILDGVVLAFARAGKTEYTIPDGVTAIGGGAFGGCSSLTRIHIPDGVTSIGNGAFNGCSSLTSINIPNGVTSIEAFAFYDCCSLTSVYCKPITPPTLDNYAFSFSNAPSFTTPLPSMKIYVPAASVEAYRSNWSIMHSGIENQIFADNN